MQRRVVTVFCVLITTAVAVCGRLSVSLMHGAGGTQSEGYTQHGVLMLRTGKFM